MMTGGTLILPPFHPASDVVIENHECTHFRLSHLIGHGFGGFHRWGSPKWLVYNGKSNLNGWFWGNPYFRKPSFPHLQTPLFSRISTLQAAGQAMGFRSPGRWLQLPSALSGLNQKAYIKSIQIHSNPTSLVVINVSCVLVVEHGWSVWTNSRHQPFYVQSINLIAP